MKIKGAFELLGGKKLTGRSRMIDRFIGREWRFVRRKLTLCTKNYWKQKCVTICVLSIH